MLRAQLEPDVTDLLCGLLGRLLFRVGQLDNFQVMPFLLGAGGTGKSLVLSVVEKLVGEGAAAPLPTTGEEVFGLANLYDADVVLERDVPQKLNKALSEDNMRSMVTGEPMTISRKRLDAVKHRWTAPLIMAGNSAPDYTNTGGNLTRRFVTFRFNNPVVSPRLRERARVLSFGPV